MKQLKNQRGLTLIELLAVIVILAIIAAIAAVAIGNVINNSKDKAALSDGVMILEGAKLANLDQACTEASGSITCTGADLKPFVSADLKDYYDNADTANIAVFTAENESGGEWELKATKDMKAIKNTKYQVTGDTITESALKSKLKQDKKQ